MRGFAIRPSRSASLRAAFLPRELLRPSPALVSRMAFRRLSGASIHGKGLRVGASFSDSQCLIDIIFTNENFQSGFLSKLIKQVGYRTAAPVRLCVLPSRPPASILLSAVYMGVRS